MKEIYADIPGVEFIGVFVPVEWNPKENVQMQGEWDGVVVVKGDNRENILEGYRRYQKRYPKDEYPRKHITSTKTIFLYNVEELIASEEEKAKWERYRQQRKASKPKRN